MSKFSCLTGTLLDSELGSADSTVLFTTARRQAAVKDGECQFADLTECLVRRSTIAITGGTREYDLNSTLLIASGDFIRLAAKESVSYVYTNAASQVTTIGGDDLPQRDLRWFDQNESGWRDSTGAYYPHAFYLRPDGGSLYLGFVDIPSTGSSASATCVVPYVAWPSASTASTYVPFTVGSAIRTDLLPYHPALVHYAAHQLEKLRKNTEGSDRQLTRFIAYVTRYLQQQRAKGGQTVRYGRNYLRQARRSVAIGIRSVTEWR